MESLNERKYRIERAEDNIRHQKQKLRKLNDSISEKEKRYE
jgi:hypothetical protein